MQSTEAKQRCNTADMQSIDLHRADSLTSETSVTVNKKRFFSGWSMQAVRAGTADLRSRALVEIKDLNVEMIMFTYMFAYILRQLSSVTMVMDKVCIVHFGHSEYICSNLKDYEEIKTQVEKVANNYNLAHSMIHSIPAAVLSCFIGAWSDRYSRKIPIMIALTGIILDGLGTIVCAMAFYTRVEYYLIPAFFTGFSGGFIVVLTVLYSYVADNTPIERRTMKYAIMEMVFGLSVPLGAAAGGWIFKASGYVPLFMLSCMGHIFALGWVLFMLKETKGLDNTESWASKFKKLWSFKPFLESFHATVKQRPNKGKQQIFLIILGMSIAYFNVAASAYVGYMFVHHVFDWDNPTFANVTAIFSVISMLFTVVAVPIFKKLKLGDPAMGIVGTLSIIAKSFMIGVSKTKGIYYLANFAGLLSTLATLAGRSRISKVVPKDDIGKVFSFMTTAEMVLPVLSSAAVIQIFNATVDFYPGLTYMVVGVVMIVPLVVFIWMSRLPNVNYEELHNENNEGELHNKNNEEEIPKDEEMTKY